MVFLVSFPSEDEAAIEALISAEFDRDFIKLAAGLVLLKYEVPGGAGVLLGRITPLTHDHVIAFDVREAWGTRVPPYIEIAMNRILPVER